MLAQRCKMWVYAKNSISANQCINFVHSLVSNSSDGNLFSVHFFFFTIHKNLQCCMMQMLIFAVAVEGLCVLVTVIGTL